MSDCKMHPYGAGVTCLECVSVKTDAFEHSFKILQDAAGRCVKKRDSLQREVERLKAELVSVDKYAKEQYRGYDEKLAKEQAQRDRLKTALEKIFSHPREKDYQCECGEDFWICMKEFAKAALHPPSEGGGK